MAAKMIALGCVVAVWIVFTALAAWAVRLIVKMGG